jgi:hypothetical protein
LMIKDYNLSQSRPTRCTDATCSPHLVLCGQPKYTYISHAFPYFKESSEFYKNSSWKLLKLFYSAPNNL